MHGQSQCGAIFPGNGDSKSPSHAAPRISDDPETVFVCHHSAVQREQAARRPMPGLPPSFRAFRTPARPPCRPATTGTCAGTGSVTATPRHFADCERSACRPPFYRPIGTEISVPMKNKSRPRFSKRAGILFMPSLTNMKPASGDDRNKRFTSFDQQPAPRSRLTRVKQVYRSRP